MRILIVSILLMFLRFQFLYFFFFSKQQKELHPDLEASANKKDVISCLRILHKRGLLSEEIIEAIACNASRAKSVAAIMNAIPKEMLNNDIVRKLFSFTEYDPDVLILIFESFKGKHLLSTNLISKILEIIDKIVLTNTPQNIVADVLVYLADENILQPDNVHYFVTNLVYNQQTLEILKSMQKSGVLTDTTTRKLCGFLLNTPFTVDELNKIFNLLKANNSYNENNVIAMLAIDAGFTPSQKLGNYVITILEFLSKANIPVNDFKHLPWNKVSDNTVDIIKRLFDNKIVNKENVVEIFDAVFTIAGDIGVGYIQNIIEFFTKKGRTPGSVQSIVGLINSFADLQKQNGYSKINFFPILQAFKILGEANALRSDLFFDVSILMRFSEIYNEFLHGKAYNNATVNFCYTVLSCISPRFFEKQTFLKVLNFLNNNDLLSDNDCMDCFTKRIFRDGNALIEIFNLLFEQKIITNKNEIVTLLENFSKLPSDRFIYINNLFLELKCYNVFNRNAFDLIMKNHESIKQICEDVRLHLMRRQPLTENSFVDIVNGVIKPQIHEETNAPS